VRGGEVMRELTNEEMLEILCAPKSIDEPEEMDFYDEDYDEAEEEMFVEDWIEEEMN
jgi:hypothetical protein